MQEEILREQFKKIKKVLLEAKRPLLVIHPQPDADALGAVFALAHYLKNQPKKSIKIFSFDLPSNIFLPLFPIDQVKNTYQLSEHDALVFLDRGDVFFKLGFDKALIDLPNLPVINIDHHPHTFITGAINVLDTKASATSEIIYRFFDFLKYPLEPEIAQYLLNGIFSDTGGFKHNNTTSQTLEIASFLMKKGASIPRINRQLFANKSIHTLKLWSIALDRARINPKTGMVVSFVTKKDIENCGASQADVSSISEILNTIADSKFSLVISEREANKLKASLRSEEYKGVDVSQIAREFMGGGHKLASGFEIKGRLRQVGDSWIIE